MTTNWPTIQLAIKGDVEKGLALLLQRLDLLGKACYEEAKNRRGYQKRSGNLMASTGYIILNEGTVVSEGGFEPPEGPERTDTDPDGSIIGREYAYSLIPEWSKGYAMIFVAGMHYAGYVEGYGYNVITSAHLWAQQNALKILNGMGL